MLVLLIGCSQKEQTQGNSAGQPVVCNKPYILVGTGCCLDQNNNSICDKDETAQQAPQTEPKQPPSGTPNSTSAPNATPAPAPVPVPNSSIPNAAPTPNATLTPAPSPNNSCVSQFTDTKQMDIFDSHVHISPKISASQMISEMNKAGVSVANLYGDRSNSLNAISQYPGRFVTFADTPDYPKPSAWLAEGPAFAASAEQQLKTGRYDGVGEANLRYYSGRAPIPPPDIYVPADNPLWLALVDLSARYHVPISFHFIPDDPVANAAFERMLNHNKDATLIWAHLGFNDLPLNSTELNGYFLRYPNLYLDTAGLQNMQNPLPQPNSNWALLANQSDKGRLNGEWRQFFETWNARILFGSDAGGGGNGLERWLNYADNSVGGATPDAVGHWKQLFSNLDRNSARNIMSGNARELFLKEQKPPYEYLVSSDGRCYSVFVSSNSSVSGLAFDPDTRAITFTVAGSSGTAGSAAITIPTALARGNFTASVDGRSVESQSASNSTHVTIRVEYAGGIRTITLKEK